MDNLPNLMFLPDNTKKMNLKISYECFKQIKYFKFGKEFHNH